MKETGWSSLMDEVSSFCGKQCIDVPNMDDKYVAQGRSRRRAEELTNSHYNCVEFFYSVLDMQLQELNNRFSEINTKLLLSIACINPSNSFVAYDKEKLTQFAQFYPQDFSDVEPLALPDQVENFIIDERSSVDFLDLKGINEFSQMMVKTRRDTVYLLVYNLITLALILPVATATVERAFSAIKIVKNRLRNRMGDQWMNDSLIVYIEKDIFNSIPNEAIMHYFQNMKSRRGQL